MINIKGILLIKKKTMSTTKYFHLKLMILVFVIDMVHCMNIQIICLSLVLKKILKEINHFWKIYQKGLSLSVYTTKDESNTEKTYDDLVLNNKK